MEKLLSTIIKAILACLGLSIPFIIVVRGSDGGTTFNEKTIPAQCLNTPPIQSNYIPKGIKCRFGDMDIYDTGPHNSSRILINLYDIFGFHENVMQVADILGAAGGFRIVMPDYFRGSPFALENFPPKDFSEIGRFLEEKGSWRTAKEDTINVMKYLKDCNPEAIFGIYGSCWGGKIAIQAASELDSVKVSAALHPIDVVTEEANQVKIPLYVFPTQDEPDMVPFYEIMKKKLGEEHCGHKRFDDMHHGFSGARGNFSDPKIAHAVDEAIQIMMAFFNKHLQ